MDLTADQTEERQSDLEINQKKPFKIKYGKTKRSKIQERVRDTEDRVKRPNIFLILLASQKERRERMGRNNICRDGG